MTPSKTASVTCGAAPCVQRCVPLPPLCAVHGGSGDGGSDWRPFGVPSLLPCVVRQVTSDDIKPYLGDGSAERREEIGARARRLMRSEYRCEMLPAFRAAVQALVDAAYPDWCEASFYGMPTKASALRPCAG